MVDLGWLNAGGDTVRLIHGTLNRCLELGHRPLTTPIGLFHTTHETLCHDCGYVFHEDSGD